jgi:DNA polymerase III subunit beta|tara:strand:- start:26887 stop:27987 length:1101 start_codon:yes stop_codon:yes gene_type:complete
MELTVTQENLTRALGAASRVASTKTQLPILSNILLRTDGHRLMVAATNLEIASTQLIGAKIINEGAITIPARLITEFVSSLPKTTVTMKVTDNKLNIKADGYTSTINGIVADDFPELPTINEKTAVSYSIDTASLKQAIGQTILTASNDATRPVLTGVYWHSHEGSLYLAATDGYRLSEKKLVATKSDVSAIIPTSTLQEVLRTVNDDINEVEVLFDETQVRFRLNDAEITSRLIDGDFPDYRQLIPATSESVITLPRADFAQITKVAGLFARESGGSVTVTADAEREKLSLHSVASELGENTSEASATISADGQVTVNSRYLIEALGVLDCEQVIFRFSGKLSPCVLSSDQKDSDYQHIIMPLKS